MFGFTVEVYWGKLVKHHAKNRKEALEWMSAYPASAIVRVFNWRGQCVAWRRETTI